MLKVTFGLLLTPTTENSHENMCRGITKWKLTPEELLTQTRDFKTLADMNETLVAEINAIVGENDTLYHLGDWSFGGINQIWEFRKQINCKNIHLILGNHDEHC